MSINFSLCYPKAVSLTWFCHCSISVLSCDRWQDKYKIAILQYEPTGKLPRNHNTWNCLMWNIGGGEGWCFFSVFLWWKIKLNIIFIPFLFSSFLCLIIIYFQILEAAFHYSFEQSTCLTNITNTADFLFFFMWLFHYFTAQVLVALQERKII